MFEFSSILEFLEENPNWINSMMFLLVFIESLVILGLFTPATLIIPGIGALAASVNINPIVIVFWATLGMVVGDTISFLLGKMIGNKVEDWIPEKYHHYLVSARKFMKKRGILSVALGRFAGPLRCTVPFIAGSLGMKSKLFFPIEVLASPVWASIYVLTGYFLGIIFVEYFTYTLIAIILIASFYTAYKDPLKTRK
jgi:membrane protein DedA with SNARE-associated domain